MSTETATKKRKSADGTVVAAKKPKTTKPDGAVVAAKKPKTTKPAEDAKPLKSALKKSKVQTGKEDSLAKPAHSKTKKPRGSKTGIVASQVAGAASPLDDDEDLDDAAELTQDQTAALMAGFSDSEEDEANADEDEAGIALSALPSAPTVTNIQTHIKEAAASKADNAETTPGVIYIGRIPHGFYEAQMRAYFGQFGAITHLRLARNRKTGRSQHWAFVEFTSSAVADIVARTMDKYLLFGHLLQVRRIPREQVEEKMWRTGPRGGRKPAPRNKLEGSALRRGKTRGQWEGRIEKERKKRTEKAEALKELGYEFEMPTVKGVEEVPVRSEPGSITDNKDSEGEAKGQAQVETESATIVNEKAVTKKRAAADKPKASKKAVKKVKA